MSENVTGIYKTSGFWIYTSAFKSGTTADVLHAMVRASARRAAMACIVWLVMAG